VQPAGRKDFLNFEKKIISFWTNRWIAALRELRGCGCGDCGFGTAWLRSGVVRILLGPPSKITLPLPPSGRFPGDPRRNNIFSGLGGVVVTSTLSSSPSSPLPLAT